MISIYKTCLTHSLSITATPLSCSRWQLPPWMRNSHNVNLHPGSNKTQLWAFSTANPKMNVISVLHVVHLLHADRVQAGWWSRPETWLLLYHTNNFEKKLSNCSVFFRPFSVFNYNFNTYSKMSIYNVVNIEKNFILKDLWMSIQAE